MDGDALVIQMVRRVFFLLTFAILTSQFRIGDIRGQTGREGGQWNIFFVRADADSEGEA